MKALRIYLAALGLTALTACEKEIDFDYIDIEPLTVIEAELTPEGSVVAITLTTPMDEPMNRTRLTDATVTLTDLDADTTISLIPDADGNYVDPTPGAVGHRYRLSVERRGAVHEAETEMFGPAEIIGAEFNWIAMPYDDVAVFQAQFRDNPSTTGNCYWTKIFRNGKIYQWGEMDDRGAIGGVATYFTLTSRKNTDEEDDDTVLFDGDTVTVTVCPITRAMHAYLEALANDSNGPAMFTGPRCLGYFMASSPTSATVVFHPDEIPTFSH
ncbi:MAG: DUF4249 domain-containing protein [Muribaculaceae bacterium]|nr:DUF4249 domain-containing protein [Muribaculaceae bacterium]